MLGRRLRRIGSTVVVVFGVAVIVPLATGEVALVTTHGVSMLPRFHTGDLAVIIPAAQYRVGDIVGYHSPILHITVLHRIVAEHAGLFTFKGDHNSFRDPLALPASDIKGRLWLHVPHAGTVLGWVRSPAGLGLLAFVLVAFGVVGLTGPSRRQRAANRRAIPTTVVTGVEMGGQRAAARAVPVPWWPVAVLLVSACVLGLLTAASWSRPTTRASERPLTYDQHVGFSYSATASPGVTYPTGSVATGDPVFLRLVSVLDVKAHYTFDVTPPGPSTGATPTHDGLQMGSSGISCGPAARLLAMLEHTLGWEDHADWHFADAIESSRRFNSPVWTARCHLDWAKTWMIGAR